VKWLGFDNSHNSWVHKNKLKQHTNIYLYEIYKYINILYT